jgi:predicted extracellular nuclease
MKRRAEKNRQERGNKGIRIAFYNVENLFDIYNDSLKDDDEFLPDGAKGWTYKRYLTKQQNIYKVLQAVGGWELPEIVGFCEIENRFVLNDLLKKTPFHQHKYGIVHEESPDARGVDVGLIYNKEKIKILAHQAIPVVFPFAPESKTRDILYAKALVLNKDTLHIFVNHWPSRRGGQAKSEPRRMIAAAQIRTKVDSLQAVDPEANIVIMGDLNDEPMDKSVREGLRAKGQGEALQEGDLFDYMTAMSKNWRFGSHKYQSHWGIIDHMIVSQAMLKSDRPKGRLRADADGAQICAERFLFEEDKQYLGLKPFRTYAGPKYIDGFSDHLPIYLDLWLEPK